MLKFLLPLLGLATLAWLGLLIDGDSSKGTIGSAPGASRGAIHASGRVEGATLPAELRAQVVGRVLEVAVCEGDVVKAGDLLLKLDGAAQRFRFALAKAELAAAEAQRERLVNGAHALERSEAAARLAAVTAQLEGAQRRLARAAQLRGKGAVSQQQLDDFAAEERAVQAQVDAAQARNELLAAPARQDDLRLVLVAIDAARARLELARSEWEQTVILAPCDAQVLKIGVQAGELATPAAAAPAVVVVDTATLHVRAFLEELDAPRVAVGMPARITADGLPEQVFTGRVVRLAARMSQKALRTDDPAERLDERVREVWIELASPGPLLVGLCVDVELGGNAEVGK
ncbi:MAG TPA: HlyD family efflux transporter periplasmic adaptor subunit [Pirellulales bacterium]|jgi:multidrug resistance efflux pump|nr:HlyD family efflux transporter periplasmic adaptor subunit [Pirellulales bacterium]